MYSTSSYGQVLVISIWVAESAGDVEYTDCVSAEG